MKIYDVYCNQSGSSWIVKCDNAYRAVDIVAEKWNYQGEEKNLLEVHEIFDCEDGKEGVEEC